MPRIWAHPPPASEEQQAAAAPGLQPALAHSLYFGLGFDRVQLETVGVTLLLCAWATVLWIKVQQRMQAARRMAGAAPLQPA